MNKLKSIFVFNVGKNISNHMISLWRKFYWWNRARISPSKNKQIIKQILSERSIIKLELGSPKRQEMQDWIASDINGYGDLKIDFTKPIPFPDNSVDYIYSSHILEHFSYPNPMLGFLKECHRILKSDGVFSICVPNARIFLNAYIYPENFDKEKFCSWEVGLKYKSPIDYVNFIAYLGGEHMHLFDSENLLQIIEEAGFTNVSERMFSEEIDLEVRQHESIYAIANK